MKKTTLTNLLLLLALCSACLLHAQDPMRYYFRTLDIKDGLSQNTVNAILQDRRGFMWFGTKDGLNRYDGLSFRIFKKEETTLGNNFITALYEDARGNIWIGTDAGVYIYDPVAETFTAFDRPADTGESISRAVTLIGGDTRDGIWISVDYQGLFHYDPDHRQLYQVLQKGPDGEQLANVTRFWFEGDTCWISLYDDNLYHTDDSFGSLVPFRDADGNEPFKDDIVNTQLAGPYHRWYIGSANGLTEINRTTGKSRRLLDAYVRDLKFKSDRELWAATESGLYICNLETGSVTHLTASEQNDSYALADNALYALCRDSEGGMWIGSYFGGVNYYPRQWTYFEKFYPCDALPHFGRRVRELCESNDGTLWIGTEDKGLFHFDPATRQIVPFLPDTLYHNIHGLCLDGDDLWVGTFSAGLYRIDLRTRRVEHYIRGTAPNTLDANNVFSICKTTAGELWIGTTSGLLRYNRATDDFTRIPALASIFVYHILEDFNGNLWLATYSNGLFRYDIRRKEWKNFVANKNDPTSLPYDKVISLYEDSRKRLWMMTQGAGFCRFEPETERFVRYDGTKGFPSPIVYRMVEDDRGNLWLTTNNGLVCFDPDTGRKQVYTTANGLLSNQFNYQSGYKDAQGRLYLGSINGLIRFDPATFVENTFVPPVVLTDFFLFNKRVAVGEKGAPLTQSIVSSDRIELKADQNSFSLHPAALSYQAPEMNRLLYRLEGFDKEWYAVGRNPAISYSNLPFGTYRLRLRGSNSDGHWNPAERRLDIHIRPPFYLSTVAHAFYLALGLLSVAGGIGYYRKRNRRKQQKAMEKFEREKERELYAAKIEFFTNVAHEIRTPLTLIKSPLENVLSSHSLPGDARDDLEIMNLNTNRLLDLVNQLLDFRKTETHGFQLNFTASDLPELIRQTYTRFTSLARQRQLAFTLDLPDRLAVSADREALTKIVSNLFGNAVKYAATYIRVELRKEGDRFRLSVANDGKIIPPALREEIFKPFIQYRENDLRHVSGTGIGLALARSLAELHGGTLRMDEAADCNRFLLDLPCRRDGNVPATPPGRGAEEEPKPAGTPAAGRQFRYTLLVAEDHPEMLQFVVKQLSPLYQVLAASNGAEALKLLEQQTVHLVISDIVMPEMDGLELCDRLKAEVDYSHIPVVLLTAKSTLQAKIDGLKSGADAYIEKPFSVEYLKVCVSNLLSNREKLRAAFAHSPFVPSGTLAVSKAEEAFLKTLNEVVSSQMQDPEFSIDDLAARLNMSRSSLNRKIKGVLDMTPNDYIRLERLKKAAQLLKEGECKVNEICYRVGFNTPSYFTKCFQKQFGILPKDFVK